MANWIDITDVQAIFNLNPIHQDNIRFNTHIALSQKGDIEPLLGRDLYNDILQDVDATAEGSYPDLLNGSTYTYDGKTYTHAGLKVVLSYFTLARYMYAGQEEDTAFGMASFTNNERFNMADEQTRRGKYNYYRRVAMDHWRDVEYFLNAQDGESTEYTYWYCGNPRYDTGEESLEIDSGSVG